MRSLGISAFYHDSAAALCVDGVIVAAAQEERFSRKKHDSRFPASSLSFCLERAGLSLDEIDYVVFYDKPFVKFERLLETYLEFAPRGYRSFAMALPVWLKEKLLLRSLIAKEFKKLGVNFDGNRKLLFSSHHQSHAASAFYPSPFESAAILTMDGVGEWQTTTLAVGRGNEVETVREIVFPHSIGLLYSAFTYYTGFKVNSGEYKVMGLAPYGTPRFAGKIRDHLIDIKEDGSFRLNLEYFDYCTGLRMTNDKFSSLFGGPPRKSDDLLDQRCMDIAASIQAVTEDIVLRLTRDIAATTGERNLCLAGGVALNCVANGLVVRDGHFDNIWVQPAAGDAGGAIGAALAAEYEFAKTERSVDPSLPDGMSGSYLGPSFSQAEIEQRLSSVGARFSIQDEAGLVGKTATALASGMAVGWFQGRMEFGPRALGGRSILADPRLDTTQKTLNLKVKYRESFRPFAPAVLREDVSQWFDLSQDSPYMLIVAPVREEIRRALTAEEDALFGIEKLNVPRSTIPAVTHVDYSARVQTVDQRTNPSFHALISKFKEMTGCGVLVNTSFNVRGEPIVATPEDAFRCFMGTELDVLAIGNCYLEKGEQDASLRRDYKNAFDPD
jgi:carbamoyltransferase